jgi:lipoprotein-anchoring transpeptidase ErfK/SrfK
MALPSPPLFGDPNLEHPPMSLRKFMSKFSVATAMAVSVLAAPHTASAQSIDFLWGGSDDFGGGRQTVGFSTQYNPGQVIVSFSDRRLYLVTKPGQALSYPIAVPRTQSRWQGTTFVSDKRINPPWTPTPEMRRENPRLPNWVPGGHPMNPLGVRAMYLGSSAYRIHGTDAPWTIGQAVSKGCVRMTNEDVLDLYPRVPVGARVMVTWDRFKTGGIASNDSGSGSYADDAQPKRRYLRPANRPVQRKYYRSSSIPQNTAAVE